MNSSGVRGLAPCIGEMTEDGTYYLHDECAGKWEIYYQILVLKPAD